MSLSIISQRGKGNVKEDKWYNQNHATSKWGEAVGNNWSCTRSITKKVKYF